MFSGDSHSAISPQQKERREDLRGDRGRSFSNGSRGLRDEHLINHRGDPREAEYTPPPLQELETARDEVREVLLQYTASADPAESAVRKERLRQAEAQEKLDDSAARIVRVRQARLQAIEETEPTPAPLSNSQERVPIANRLGPLNDNEPDQPSRIPIMDILGPLLDEASEQANLPTETTQAPKRKPGRPPGKKKVHASPLSLAGVSSKLRKVNNSKPLNCRKKLSVAPGRDDSPAKKNAKNIKAPRGRKAIAKSGVPQSREDTNSDNVPICNMVPPSMRSRMDFRIQSNSAP